MNRKSAQKQVVLAMGLIGMIAMGASAAAYWDSLIEMYYLWGLESADESRWREASEKLVKLKSKKAIPYLLRILEGENELSLEQERQEKISCLSNALSEIIRDIEPGERDVVPALLEILRRNEFPWLRRMAAHALVRIGPSSIPLLRTGLRDDSPGCRTYAAWALGKMGPLAGDTVPDLIVALRDPNYSVRFFAAFALGNIGQVDRDAIEALCGALEDENDLVSSAASGALEKIGRPLVKESGRTGDSRNEESERRGTIRIR